VATENVAIVFTDVVGSTELSRRLSPEVAEEVRRGHFSILRQAIAEAGGTEVKNLGDGLMVAFASPSGALACAVAMQQGVELDNRGREHSVGLRVGLSIGEVAREDDDYFGDAVVEAARLCAISEGGQILATDVVPAMAGRRNRHECRSVGEIILKGLPDPVATVEVIWEPLGGTQTGTVIPLPARLAVRPTVGLFGREAEMQTMADAAKRVAGGEGREILLISGEAGTGKTTLMAEAARGEFDSGAVVLLGHCEEDLATPYQLFAEALGHYVTRAPEDQLLAHLAEYGSELSRLTPALARRIPDLPTSKATDTDTERFLLFAAVVGLLAQMSEDQSVILVLDDLQWADKGSLLLLRHLAATDQAMRVLVLGSYRDGELSRSHPLFDAMAALRREDRVSRIGLAGLDDTAVVALLEAAAGQALDETGMGLAHAVYRETDGNPFFVSEVLRHLTETGALYQDSTGRWVSDLSLNEVILPDSVREVIGARVGRLGLDAAKVLSTAAVIGRDFDLDLLARAAETSEDDLLDTLEAAAAVALVREPSDASGHYSFTHALIQHTLADDLGPNRRARAHRKVAEALEDLCGDRPGARVGELARHWLSTTQPIDITKAISYARQAGDAALAALAPADALSYYAQALDLYPQVTDPDPVLVLDLAVGLGTAQRQTGDPAFRETLLDAARRAAHVGDTERLVTATLANHRGLFSTAGTIDADKVEVLETTLDRLPPDYPGRALVLSTLCSELSYGSPLAYRQALANEALAIAESTSDDAIIVRVLNDVSVPLRVPSLHDLSLARTSDALARAVRLADPVLLLFAVLWRAQTAATSGDIDESERCFEIMGPLVQQLDQPILNWMYTLHRVWRAAIAGDSDEVEQLAAQAFQIGTDGGQPDAGLLFGSHVIQVSLQRGTLGDLAPLIEQTATEAPEMAGVFKAALAGAHAEGGRTDHARDLLEELATAGFDLPLDSLWLTSMSGYAEAAIAVSEPMYAGPLFDRLAPWADQLANVGSTASGPVSHYLGGLATVLGRYDEADAHFAQSAAMSERMGAKFFAARTDLLWGKMLTERKASGDIEMARDHLTKAYTVAAANGYANVERRATETLRLLDG
jgi:class 3 adenylate cyclase/tetratricopeptide (TPR) repeat protein